MPALKSVAKSAPAVYNRHTENSEDSMSTYNSRAAVQSIMAIAESENSKPGRVTMPKVFLGVGIFDVIAMGVGIYFSLRFKEIIPAVIFSILALLGIFSSSDISTNGYITAPTNSSAATSGESSAPIATAT